MSADLVVADISVDRMREETPATGKKNILGRAPYQSRIEGPSEDHAGYEILTFFGLLFSVFGSSTDKTPSENVALIFFSSTEFGRRIIR